MRLGIPALEGRIGKLEHWKDTMSIAEAPCGLTLLVGKWAV